MDRKEFLQSLGISAGSLMLTTCLGGCGKSDSNGQPNPPAGGTVDFNFDVTTDVNLTNRGWTVRSGAIIAKVNNSYVAYDASCPHQGNALTYNPANGNYPCSQTGADHGSVFNADGKRIAGPASRDMTKYNTTLTGNSLRVFS
jgi:cytochrome b6-f complex iron-sulfur subunit